MSRCAEEALKLQIFPNASGWGFDILWQISTFSVKAFAEANRAARFKEAALVLSQAGRATELYLILTIPEIAVFPLTKEGRWHQTQVLQSRAWIEAALMPRVLGTPAWPVGIYLLELRLEGCYFNWQVQKQNLGWWSAAHFLLLPSCLRHWWWSGHSTKINISLQHLPARPPQSCWIYSESSTPLLGKLKCLTQPCVEGKVVSAARSAKPQMFEPSHLHLQRTCSLISFSPLCSGIVVRRLCKCQNHYQSQASRLLIELLFSCLTCCIPKKRLHC